MRKILKNKKGDIPVTILVIGILAICLLAILSFYISDRNTKNTLNSADLPELVTITKEKMSVYGNLGMNSEEIERMINLGLSSEEREKLISDGSHIPFIEIDVQGKFIYLEQDGVSVRYNLP